MNNGRTRTILVFMFLIAVASGCTDTGGTSVSTTQTQAIEIMNLTAFPQDTFDTQQVSMRLRIKNTGEKTANNVVAKLYNVPFSGSNAWSSDPSDQTLEFNTLTPADPENNIPSTPRTKVWTLTPPDLEEGVSIPYTFHSRLFFDYSTTAVSEIKLMSSNRFRETGGGRSKPNVDNTGGPVQLEIRTRSPLIFFPSDDQRTSDLCVIATDEGEGTPYLPDANIDSIGDAKDKIKLTIEGSGSVGFPDSASQTTEMSLINGRGIHCFTLKANSAGSGIQETVPVTLTADYGYYKDAQTTVTVTGRRESGSNDDSSSGKWKWTGSKGSMWEAASDGGSLSEHKACQWLAENYNQERTSQYCEK